MAAGQLAARHTPWARAQARQVGYVPAQGVDVVGPFLGLDEYGRCRCCDLPPSGCGRLRPGDPALVAAMRAEDERMSRTHSDAEWDELMRAVGVG